MKTFLFAIIVNVTSFALDFSAAQRAAAMRIAKLNATYTKEKSRIIRDREQQAVGEAFHSYMGRLYAALEAAP